MSLTFSETITRVADIANRTDIDTQIAYSINAALRKIERKHNYNYMLTRNAVAVSLTSGSYTVAYPTRFKQFTSFKVFSGTTFENNLTFVDEVTAYNKYPDVTLDTGTPELGSLLPDSSLILIRPTPAENYNLWYVYYAYSATLVVSSVESHWLLSNAEDVLIYGALMELMPIVKDYDREPLWRGRFNEAMRDLKVHESTTAEALTSPFVSGAYGTS